MAVIAIDVGGTKIKAGIMSTDGKMLAIFQKETNKAAVMDQLTALIQEIMQQEKYPIEAIGVGTAGRVNFAEGSIHYATPNLLNWTGTRVKDILQATFHVPVVVDNDANAAAVAEGYFGAARSRQNYICITLGTGVGAGIVVGGSLVRGKVGAGGEVGHMIFSSGGRSCNCGKQGCWEQYVSGNALQSRIDSDPALSNRGINPTEMFRLYLEENNPHAEKIVDEFVEQLATGLGSLQNIIDPECFVLGGGVIHSHSAWWTKLLEALRQQDQTIEVYKAHLDNEAGMIGAGILAYQAIGRL